MKFYHFKYILSVINLIIIEALSQQYCNSDLECASKCCYLNQCAQEEVFCYQIR